eukprot:gene3789-4370_t
MGHPLELSSIEINFIEEWVNTYYGRWGETIIFRGYVLSKKKSDSKWISSILVITNYHMFLFSEGKELTKKQPRDYHIYDIKKLVSKVEYVLTVSFQHGKTKSKAKFKTEQMSYVLSLLRRLLHLLNGEHCAAEPLVSVKSVTGVPSMERKEYSSFEEFSDLYKGWCAYFQADPHQPLQNFIQKTLAESCREIDLHSEIQTSDHSDIVFDIVPVLHALKHDHNFNSIIVRDLKKDAAVKALADLILHNTFIKKLVIKRCGNDSLQNIFFSLSLNKKNAIQLFEAFEKNYGMSLTLEFLNVSHNKFDESTNNAFSSWILKSRGHLKLRQLLLNSTGITTHSFYCLSGLERLEHLDISNNRLEIAELDKLLPVLAISTLHRIDANQCGLSKEVISLLFCKMTDKKASVHIELEGVSLVGEDNFEMLFNSIALFKDAAVAIRHLNLRALKGTEKNIVALLQVLADIRVNELVLEGLSVFFVQTTALRTNNISLDSSLDGSQMTALVGEFHQTNGTAPSSPMASGGSSPAVFSLGGGGGFSGGRLALNLSGSQDANDHAHASPKHTSHNPDDGSAASSSSPLTSSGGDIGAGLSINQSFKTLFIKSLQKIYLNNDTRTLNLSNIGRIIFSFLPLLSKDSSVTSLDISRNSLGDEGAVILAGSLAVNRTILSINIDGNSMTNVGWSELLIPLSECGKSIIRESPNVPLNTSHSRLHSMPYPRYDFERVLVATDDPYKRASIYMVMARLQMALVANGNILYADRAKHHNKLPLGLVARRRISHYFPQTPTVLYPLHPVPLDITQALASKSKIAHHPAPPAGSAMSTITQFLKAPGLRSRMANMNHNSSNSSHSNSLHAGPTTGIVISHPLHLRDSLPLTASAITHHTKSPHLTPTSPSMLSSSTSSTPKHHSSSERTSPIPFAINLLSSSGTDNTKYPSFPRRSSPSAYPAIPLFEDPSPVTQEQLLDAINNLEMATTYCTTLIGQPNNSGMTSPSRTPPVYSPTISITSDSSTPSSPRVILAHKRTQSSLEIEKVILLMPHSQLHVPVQDDGKDESSSGTTTGRSRSFTSSTTPLSEPYSRVRSQNIESIMKELTGSEKSELSETMAKFTSLFSGLGGMGFDDPSAAAAGQQQQQQQPQPGIDIKDFENNISNVLKGLADNASTQVPQGDPTEELLKQFSNLMGGMGGEGGEGDLGGVNDSINGFYEDSMKYIVDHYPKWIEDNQDKYTAEEIGRFREQCDVFIKVFAADDKDIGQEEMFSKVSMLGQLPEAFCEEYFTFVVSATTTSLVAAATGKPMLEIFEGLMYINAQGRQFYRADIANNLQQQQISHIIIHFPSGDYNVQGLQKLSATDYYLGQLSAGAHFTFSNYYDCEILNTQSHGVTNVIVTFPFGDINVQLLHADPNSNTNYHAQQPIPAYGKCPFRYDAPAQVHITVTQAQAI